MGALIGDHCSKTAGAVQGFNTEATDAEVMWNRWYEL